VQHDTGEAKVEACIDLEDDNDNGEGIDLEELLGKQEHMWPWMPPLLMNHWKITVSGCHGLFVDGL
jgi:hypothetical protein